MTRWCDDDDAMTRWCKSAIAMVWHCDGDGAMTMVQRFDDDKALVYRAIVFAKSGYGLFCTCAVCKKRATKLLCSIWMLWFTYHLSLMDNCIKCIHTYVWNTLPLPRQNIGSSSSHHRHCAVVQSRHLTIALSHHAIALSYHRVIVKALSYHRVIVKALSYHRVIVKALSYDRANAITPWLRHRPRP